MPIAGSKGICCRGLHPVLADLTAARALPAANGFFANTYVASAMLARAPCNGQLCSGSSRGKPRDRIGMLSLFADIRSNGACRNGAETIFAIQTQPQHHTTWRCSMRRHHTGVRVQVLDSHLQRYQAGDQRATVFTQTDGRMTTKYHSDNLQ